MDPTAIIVGILTGSLITALIEWWRNRHRDHVELTAKLYQVWQAETERMTTQVDRLQVLVVALEAEVVALGGDPTRIRLYAAQHNGADQQEARQ